MTLRSDHEPDDAARLFALWSALGKLLADLASAGDQAAFLERCLDDLLELFGADRAVVLMHHDDGTVSCPCSRTRGRGLGPSERDAISRTVTQRALSSGECIVSRPLDDVDASASLAFKGIGLAMAAPVRATRASDLKPAETVGVLYVDFRDPTRQAGERERAFLQAVAHVLGAVLAPYRKLERARQDLREQAARDTPRDPSLEELLDFPSMVDIRRELASAMHGDAPILLLGESGTGKTLFARAIATATGRTPIVRAVLGSSDDLNTITSELFGHERGAFSGALGKRTGLVEFADGGTLIFDEILNLPAQAQQLLLDFTQFGTYRPLGHDRREPKQARARIIAATNGDLRAAIGERRFREDLYYRLASVVLELPPLRTRRAEIPALVRALASRFGAGEPAVRLSPALASWLAGPELGYPGNVRQLESAVRRARERALAEGTRDELDVRHFRASELGGTERGDARSGPGANVEADAPVDLHWASLQQDRAALDARERSVLARALEANGGVVAHAARSLGMARTSLSSRLEALGLGRKPRK